jgi:hypothetical protein
MADHFAGSVDIGGRTLYMETAGSGSPTVVLEAVRQVVEGVRNPDTWYTLTSCCTP